MSIEHKTKMVVGEFMSNQTKVKFQTCLAIQVEARPGQNSTSNLRLGDEIMMTKGSIQRLMPTFIIQYPCRRPADVLDTKTSQSSAQIKDKTNVKYSGTLS